MAYPWNRTQRLISESFPITPSVDWFKNGYGSIKWWRVRSAYWDNSIDEDFVTTIWKEWRDTPEFLKLDGYTAGGDFVISTFVKACKRGNDVYLSRINERFGFMDSLPPLEFFPDWGRKSTPMLFVTLTVDTKLYSLKEAWLEISQSYNRFETLLRQKYGKFVKFRVWESHESGYCHCHVAYYFLDRWFEVFEHFSKKGERTFRIADKHRKAIGHMWNMSHDPRTNGGVDIQGVQDTNGAFKEIKKYITKNIWNQKGDKTNALCTLFRKQSYYLSQFNYRKHVQKKIRKDHPTVDELAEYIAANVESWAKRDFIGAIWGYKVYMDVYQRLDEGLAPPRLNALVTSYLHNYNIEFPEIAFWEFSGVISGVDLNRFVPDLGDKWAVALKDPPPELYCYVSIRGVD